MILQQKNYMAHTLHGLLRKETPRSSPLFIYSCCSPVDFPLAALLRRARNKRTGQGGGSPRRQSTYKASEQCSWSCDETVSVLCWCFSWRNSAHFWCVAEMLSTHGIINMIQNKVLRHVRLKFNQSFIRFISVLEIMCLCVYDNRLFLELKLTAWRQPADQLNFIARKWKIFRFWIYMWIIYYTVFSCNKSLCLLAYAVKACMLAAAGKMCFLEKLLTNSAVCDP